MKCYNMLGYIKLTEGEIKYILFIAYLDAPRDPRGVKRCAIIHALSLDLEV